jgi:hypothetical protein
MDFLRRNIVTIAVLIAIALSLGISLHQTAVNAAHAKRDDVASCVRANTRSALTAAWQRSVVPLVKDQPELADEFAAYAHGSAVYLAIAQYVKHPENATRVHEIHIGAEHAMVLTRAAEHLIIEGCARAFHSDTAPKDYPALGLQR